MRVRGQRAALHRRCSSGTLSFRAFSYKYCRLLKHHAININREYVQYSRVQYSSCLIDSNGGERGAAEWALAEYYFLGRRGGSSVPSKNARDRYVSTGARTAAQAPPKPRRKPLPPLLSNLRSILSNLFSPPGGAGTVEPRGCLRFSPHRRRVDDRDPSESRPWMHAMVPGVLVRARRRLCGDGTGSFLDTSSPTAC